MAKPNTGIANNYDLFKRLVDELKLTVTKVIYFKDYKPQRKDLFYSEEKLTHQIIDDNVLLLLESKSNDPKAHRFQLRCTALCSEPYFRYDSYGSSHRNHDAPLKDSKIDTPHFNTFDDRGRSVAYQTPELKQQAEALSDINFAFAHFCYQCNLRYPEDEFPEVVHEIRGQLNFKNDNDDLLSNVNFDL